jgi:hypothetical protein
MWRFVIGEAGWENEYSEPASSFSIPEIKKIPLSGGSLQFFSAKEFEGLPLKEPDVLLDSAISWLKQRGVPESQIKQIHLIHIPFYLFKYQYRGTLYQAIVDASSGRVLASVYPAKEEIPFIGIAVAAAITFFVLGVVVSHAWLRLGLYLLAAIPFGIVSYSIVRKY